MKKKQYIQNINIKQNKNVFYSMSRTQNNQAGASQGTPAHIVYRRCYKNAPFKKRKRKKNKFRQIMSFGEHSLSQLAFSCLYHSSWEAKFVCFLIFVQLPSWSIILFLDFMGFVVETYSSQDGRRQVDVHYGRFSP